MFDVKCPNCERTLQLPEDALGRECQCPSCHRVFRPTTAGYEGDGSPAAIEVPDIRIGPDDPADDLEILAERKRYLREIEGDNPEAIEEQERWTATKRAAIYGFAVGIVAGIIAANLPGTKSDVCFGVFLTGVAGVIIAAGYVVLTRSHATSDRPWIRSLAKALFACSFVTAIVMHGKAEGQIEPQLVAGIALVCAAVSFFFWILLMGVAAIIRFLRK